MSEPHSIACDESGLRRAGSLHGRLWAWAVKNCIPLGASIEITLVCNLRCSHCYNFDRAVPYPKKRRGAELTPAEILGVIDQLSDEGCRFLSITGGEALLNPHLDDFIRHARKRRMIVQVKSNGVLLTEDRVRGLAEAGANGVDVSLYGATPQTHDAFTLLPGSFAKAVDGIRHTRAAGLDCILNMCIVRGNAAEVAQMIELAESLVGTNYGINPFISARYDGTTSSMDQRVSRETLEQLYRGPLRHLIPKPDFNPNRSVQCACARANCGITATGDVYPCINAPVLSGNIREDSFHNIWWTSPQFKRIRGLKLEDFPACKPCPDRPYCSRSSGAVYSDTGHYTGAEEFTCMDAGIKRMLHLEKLAIADE
jgi:radical SAM protein with 4Fe4S-binding SPASM domain